MTSISRRAAVLGALLLVVVGASCSPVQQAWWNDPSVPKETKDSVKAYYAERNAASSDCYEAIDRHWPASSREWARGIVWRESKNQPGAANPRSSARGCWQLLLGTHSGRFTKLGYSPSQWSDPDVNTLVALDLYRAAGTSPWAM